MADLANIESGMQVITSDGEFLGTVEGARADGFRMKRIGSSDAAEQTVPRMWVDRVDQHVHLNRTGAEAVAGWKSLEFQTSSGQTPGAPQAQDPSTTNNSKQWALYALAGSVVMILLLMLIL